MMGRDGPTDRIAEFAPHDFKIPAGTRSFKGKGLLVAKSSKREKKPHGTAFSAGRVSAANRRAWQESFAWPIRYDRAL